MKPVCARPAGRWRGVTPGLGRGGGRGVQIGPLGMARRGEQDDTRGGRRQDRDHCTKVHSSLLPLACSVTLSRSRRDQRGGCWLVPVIFRLSGGAAACDYYYACALAERGVADPLHRGRVDTKARGDLANTGAAGLGQRGPYAVFHPFGYRRPPQAFALTTGPHNSGAESKLLRQLVLRETAEEIDLRNGIVIRVQTPNYRRIRGFTAVAAILDEAAFWLDENTAQPDFEVLNAVRPCLATTGGLLVAISSPHARKGIVWEAFQRDYGPDGDHDILVARGSTLDFNLDRDASGKLKLQSWVDRRYERDPVAAAAECGGEEVLGKGWKPL